MGDAGLGLALHEIEDRDAGRFAAGAGRGRNGDQRLERSGHRLAAADRRVDVVEEVGRIGRVEVGGLGRVDRAAAADGDERVELPCPGDVDAA